MNDSPESAAAPEDVPSFYSGERDGYVQRQLEQLRQTRAAGELTPEQREWTQRQANATYVHQAKQAAASETRQQLNDYATRINAEHGNIHAAAYSDPPGQSDQSSDYDAKAFASSLGLPGEIEFENSETAGNEARAALNDILAGATDDELLAIIQNNPAGVEQIRAAVEKQISHRADPYWGLPGERDEIQTRNVETTALNVMRQALAHHKRGAPEPSIAAMIARARLATDPNYQPGKRGATRQFVESTTAYPNIHAALKACPL